MVRFITGDECGIIKAYQPKHVSKASSSSSVPSSAPTPDNSQQPVQRINPSDPISRRHGVAALSWMAQDRHFCALHLNGRAVVYDYDDDGEDKRNTSQYRRVLDIPDVWAADNNNNSNNDSSKANQPQPQQRALGLQRLGDRLVACSTLGMVTTLAIPSSSSLALHDGRNVNNNNRTAVRHQCSAYGGSSVTAFAASNNRNNNTVDGVVALGGKDKETVVWNVETSQQVWKAKNLPPDPQTLLQPRVWPTALCFMHSSDTTSNNTSSNLLCTGTAYHQVRVYDVRTPGRISSGGGIAGRPVSMQRRPIGYTAETSAASSTELLQHRITALCGSNSRSRPYELIVGDAAGYVCALDIRRLSHGANIAGKKGGKVVASPVTGRYVGPTGSVRQLALPPQRVSSSSTTCALLSTKASNRSAMMACVGLDRMLRVYDAQRRQLLHTVYMKQRLNCVLVSDEPAKSNDDDNDDYRDENDDDDRVYDSDDMNQQADNVEDYVDSDEEGSGMDANVIGGIDQVNDLVEEDSDDESESDSNDDEDEPEGRSAAQRKRRRQ